MFFSTITQEYDRKAKKTILTFVLTLLSEPLLILEYAYRVEFANTNTIMFHLGL